MKTPLRSSFLRLALFAGGLLLAAGSARAGDVVTNLANATNAAGEVLNFAGDTGAHAFTTGALPVRLESVKVELKVGVGASHSARVRVWSGAGAVPVTLVENLGVVTLLNTGLPETHTVVSALQPVLSANTRYWVSVSFISGNFDWDLTANTASTGTGTLPSPVVRAVSTDDGRIGAPLGLRARTTSSPSPARRNAP